MSSWSSILQVEKDIDRDRYMSPIEAMEYGIIDGVIDKDAIILDGPINKILEKKDTNRPTIIAPIAGEPLRVKGPSP